MIEQTGKVLIDSLAFKKFNNEIIKLSTIKKLVYEEENVGFVFVAVHGARMHVHCGGGTCYGFRVVRFGKQ